MKEFSELSKEDQKLICEAMSIHNEVMSSIIKGVYVNKDEELKNKCKNMSNDAKEYMIEILTQHLPKNIDNYQRGTVVLMYIYVHSIYVYDALVNAEDT